MNFKKHILVAIALLCSAIMVKAQQPHEMRAFNEAYYKSIDKLRELYELKNAGSTTCDLPRGTNFYTYLIRQIGKYEKDADTNNTAVLFYNYDSKDLRIWLIGIGRFQFDSVHILPDTLRNMEGRLRAALNTALPAQKRTPVKRGVELLTPPEEKTNLDTAIAHLTNVLLPEKIRHKLAGIKKLYIIPEFNIGQMPLYLLKPYGNGAYLVDSLAISISPHLCNFEAFLAEKRYTVGKKNSLDSTATALVVGDPQYSAGQYIFPKLPGAREEAKAIGKVLHTEPLLGDDATKSRVVKRAQDVQLLYFATHGVFDYDRLLDGSFIALAPDSTDTTGFWTAREIQETPLNADIAVLSACQTGIGKIYEAGFIGIGRAFYKAGVDNTIVSLWSVNDKATQQLMEIFIRKLKEPQFFYPAENLRQAILEYKKQDPNPANWAAFINFGFCY